MWAAGISGTTLVVQVDSYLMRIDDNHMLAEEIEMNEVA